MRWKIRKNAVITSNRIALVDELESEKAKAKRLQIELDETREKLKKIESGDCIIGRYCAFCTNTGETGVIIDGKPVFCCLENVPCKRFRRKGSDAYEARQVQSGAGSVQH